MTEPTEFEMPRHAASRADLEPEEVAPGLHRLPLEVPFEVGPVNCYLLLRGKPLLVDCGPKTDAAWASLLGHLDRLGAPPAKLAHIVTTHSHIDHHGNLGRLAALASSARLWCHEDDAHAVFDFEEHIDSRLTDTRMLGQFWGFSDEFLTKIEKMYRGFRTMADTVPRDRLSVLRGEEAALDAGGARLRALHCPGHTEGLICLLLETDGGLLLSSDHVLEKITPNPAAYVPRYRGRRTGLFDYVASLKRLRELTVARVLPGHGRTFTGLPKRIEAILYHHEERAARVRELVLATPGSTVLELALRHWEGLPPGAHWLACREMHAHLDMLVAAGRVECQAAGDAGAWFSRGE